MDFVTLVVDRRTFDKHSVGMKAVDKQMVDVHRFEVIVGMIGVDTMAVEMNQFVDNWMLVDKTTVDIVVVDRFAVDDTVAVEVVAV